MEEHGGVWSVYKAPTDYAKPQQTIQSPKTLYKAPTDYTKTLKDYKKPQKHYTKPRNIRQRHEILDKTLKY